MDLYFFVCICRYPEVEKCEPPVLPEDLAEDFNDGVNSNQP